MHQAYGKCHMKHGDCYLNPRCCACGEDMQQKYSYMRLTSQYILNWDSQAKSLTSPSMPWAAKLAVTSRACTSMTTRALRVERCSLVSWPRTRPTMLFSWLVLLSATALTPPAKQSFSHLCTGFATDKMNQLQIPPLQLTATCVGLLAPVL